jgi:hypothetical protein
MIGGAVTSRPAATSMEAAGIHPRPKPPPDRRQIETTARTTFHAVVRSF